MSINKFNMGAHSYNPEFYFNTKDFLLGNKKLLNDIRGVTVHSVIIVWSTEHKEAWLDAPILMMTDHGQIELCAFKLHEFSLTLNTIQTDISPNWFGDEKFQWRKYLEYPKGKFIIEDIEIIESMHSIDNTSYYDLNGIQFRGGENCLSVCNGLDCNLLNTSEVDQFEFKVIPF